MVASADAAVPTNQASEPSAVNKDLAPANTFVSVGKDFLSFTVSKSAEGTIVADHRSHASHSSHSSHYSSR